MEGDEQLEPHEQAEAEPLQPQPDMLDGFIALVWWRLIGLVCGLEDEGLI